MLLYGQLQEGLHLQLMRAPSVSGAKKYQELVVVAKNEERRLADLKRRQEYIRCTSQPSGPTTRHRNLSERQQNPRPRHQQYRSTPQFSQPPVASSKVDRKCYFCKKPGHLFNQCPQCKKNDEGRIPCKGSSAKQIVTETFLEGCSTKETPTRNTHLSAEDNAISSSSTSVTPKKERATPLDFLFSESEDKGDVQRVVVIDHGSHPRLARVDV